MSDDTIDLAKMREQALKDRENSGPKFDLKYLTETA